MVATVRSFRYITLQCCVEKQPDCLNITVWVILSRVTLYRVVVWPPRCLDAAESDVFNSKNVCLEANGDWSKIIRGEGTFDFPLSDGGYRITWRHVRRGHQTLLSGVNRLIVGLRWLGPSSSSPGLQYKRNELFETVEIFLREHIRVIHVHTCVSF